MIWAILGIFAGVIIFLLGLFMDKDDIRAFPVYSGVFLTVVFVIFLIACSVQSTPKPTALDVYRGRTTLEITYRDSIPIDTVVVFKEEYK